EQQVLSRTGFGLPVSATPFTSVTIPANVMTTGRIYRGSIDFDSATTFDTSGTGAVALYENETTFYIAALAPGTSALPAPVISVQPANQSGPIGGTATFSTTVNYGAAPGQFVSSTSTWYF